MVLRIWICIQEVYARCLWTTNTYRASLVLLISLHVHGVGLGWIGDLLYWLVTSSIRLPYASLLLLILLRVLKPYAMEPNSIKHTTKPRGFNMYYVYIQRKYLAHCNFLAKESFNWHHLVKGGSATTCMPLLSKFFELLEKEVLVSSFCCCCKEASLHLMFLLDWSLFLPLVQ